MLHTHVFTHTARRAASWCACSTHTCLHTPLVGLPRGVHAPHTHVFIHTARRAASWCACSTHTCLHTPLVGLPRGVHAPHTRVYTHRSLGCLVVCMLHTHVFTHTAGCIRTSLLRVALIEKLEAIFYLFKMYHYISCYIAVDFINSNISHISVCSNSSVICFPALAIDCYVCTSVDEDNKACIDPFDLGLDTYHLIERNCMYGYFRGTHCIKLTGQRGTYSPLFF